MDFKYHPIQIPEALERFIESSNCIKIKSNEWLEGEISKHGYSVKYEPYENACKGLTHHGGKTVIIFECDGSTSPRNRFTMAHELAHVLMRGAPENKFGLLTERQCDEFAGRLLVSEEFAISDWNLLGNDIGKFSESFGVSDVCAMIVLDKYRIFPCDTFYLAPIFHAKPYLDEVFPPDAALGS